MPCFESKVSRGRWEFTQWNRVGERGRSEEIEQKQQQTDSEGETDRAGQTALLLFGGGGGEESHCEDQMTANTEGEWESGGRRKRGTREGGSVWLRTRAEECQSVPAGRERLQVFICVMRSGYEARRRGGGGRGSSARRGGIQGTAVRTQSVFCCHGSSAVGEERYLSVRRSCHRYVPAQEPVSPVCRTISVSRLARGKTERVCYVVWKPVHRSRCHLGKKNCVALLKPRVLCVYTVWWCHEVAWHHGSCCLHLLPIKKESVRLWLRQKRSKTK